MTNIKLTDYDNALLSGSEGKAKQIAMNIMLKMAELQGALEFIDISNVHIDGSAYNGNASIAFPKVLADYGGEVVVPTTMNAISIDMKRWEKYDIENDFAEKAKQVPYQYERMGALTTFSCSPYQLPKPPKFGEHVAWAESNAIVFANSVIGARTNRYGDFMDICAALTGRVPLAGYHLDEERLGTMLITLPKMKEVDSSFYPLLGYLIGKQVGSGVPVIEGLNHNPTEDDLKALGAAMATTGSVGMFHIVGLTPEAQTTEEAFGHKLPNDEWKITKEELEETRNQLVVDQNSKVKMVLLGSPHFSLNEFEKLTKLTENSLCHMDVKMIITTNNYTYEKAEKKGIIAEIERFGAEVLTDCCLCMIEPFVRNIVDSQSGNIITNSGKFAHYGPGLIGDDGVFLGSLQDCVQSAQSGKAQISQPKWSEKIS